MKPLYRDRWKIVLGIVALAALGALVAPSLRAVFSISLLMRHARWPWFLAAMICQVLMYLCVAQILSISLGSLKKNVSLTSLYVPAVVFLFANRAVPGPAVAGLASLVYLLGKRGVTSADAQVTAGAFYLADYASFFGVIVFAGIMVMTGNGRIVDFPWPYLIATGIIVLICGLGIVAYSHGEKLIFFGVGILRRLEAMLRPSNGSAISERVNGLFTDLYQQSKVLLRNPSVLAALVGTGLFMHAFEALTLVCTARGFNMGLSFGAAMIAYVAGNLAAIVSFLPGGIGLYDGAMVTTLHTLGHLDLPASAATTIVYRLASLAFPLPFALRVIQRALARAEP